MDKIKREDLRFYVDAWKRKNTLSTKRCTRISDIKDAYEDYYGYIDFYPQAKPYTPEYESIIQEAEIELNKYGYRLVSRDHYDYARYEGWRQWEYKII